VKVGHTNNSNNVGLGSTNDPFHTLL